MSVESSALVDPDGLVGRVLAERYLIEERLGEGGMGMVYRASHVKMGRSFAIKILHPELLRNEKVVWRFDREADAAARMRHPNVVPALDVGTTEEGMRYLVMDFVDGPDLATLMQEAPMPPPRVIWLVRQILDGLQHAHHHDLIHRDLKPQNIIVECDADGREIPRIVDFGISILASQVDEDEGSRLTTTGMVLGTPLYMAPEQAVAGDIDHRVDLFALGLICYEMLSGALPFDGTGAQVARANLMLDPPPMSRRVPDLSVDPLLEAFTRRLMERDRDRRPANAREARDLLDLIERDRKAAAVLLSVSNDAPMSKVMTVPRLPSVAEGSSRNSQSSMERQSLGAAATELSARHQIRAASPLVMVQEEGSEVVVSLTAVPDSGPERVPMARAPSFSDGIPYDPAAPAPPSHAVSGANPAQPPFPLPYFAGDVRFPGDPPPMVAQPWQGRLPDIDRRAERYATTDHHGYRHYGDQRRRWVVVGSLGIAVAGIAIAVIVMVGGKPTRGNPELAIATPDAAQAVQSAADASVVEPSQRRKRRTPARRPARQMSLIRPSPPRRARHLRHPKAARRLVGATTRTTWGSVSGQS
jgi:serine/threonine protein kinase